MSVTELKMTEFGRSVFANTAINVGTVIEYCPIIAVPESDLIGNDLIEYVLAWPPEHEGEVLRAAVVLGWGMLMNHSFEPNVEYALIPEQQMIEFRACKRIKKGAQLFIDYKYDLGACLYNANRHWYVDAYCAWKELTTKEAQRDHFASLNLIDGPSILGRLMQRLNGTSAAVPRVPHPLLG